MTEKKPIPSATFPPLPFRFLEGIRSSKNIYGRWYAATDVARMMRAQTGSITRKLQKDEMRTNYTLTDRGYRDLTFISETALFGVIFRSTHPWAIDAQAEIIAGFREALRNQKDNSDAQG